MCVPACTTKVVQDMIHRRNFLKIATASVGLLATSACQSNAPSEPVKAKTAEVSTPRQQGITFSRVVDLTHTLTPTFPTFSGKPQLQLETLTTLAKDGYNVYRWLLDEHTGTHMDAPFHFSDKDTADKIAADNLWGPLAVVDIRAKAEKSPDAELTPEDLTAWEAAHGTLPEGAIVAMLSGWDQHVGTDKFRNADSKGTMHFPGFHAEAVAFLLEKRKIKGILVDTLSLDFGASTDFAVHYRWLPANKWGIECAANLAQLPAAGAHLIVGGPKIAGATGGLTRLFALV